MKFTDPSSTLPAIALATVVIFSVAAPAHAEPAAHSIRTHEMSGTVGAYRVGANMVVQDNEQFVAGHYFYVSRLADIPLAGRVEGGELVLTEPDGGVFRLHLESQGAAPGVHLTFYNSTGLAGRWTKGETSLPVRLEFDASYQGRHDRDWYREVTDEPDAAFEARVRRFLSAVQAGDRARAAGAVSYPLTVNGRRRLVIRDRAALLSHWDAVFTPKYLAHLRRAIPHEMFVRNGQAMVADGAAWFDDKGAAVLNTFD